MAVVALAPDVGSGRVLRRLEDPALSVPTTIDDLGRRLYTVNARFGISDPDHAAFQVVQLRKPNGR